MLFLLLYYLVSIIKPDLSQVPSSYLFFKILLPILPSGKASGCVELSYWLGLNHSTSCLLQGTRSCAMRKRCSQQRAMKVSFYRSYIKQSQSGRNCRAKRSNESMLWTAAIQPFLLIAMRPKWTLVVMWSINLLFNGHIKQCSSLFMTMELIVISAGGKNPIKLYSSKIGQTAWTNSQ